MIYDPFDYYNKKAKKQWYKARSAFKLEEIQDKFKIFDKKTKKVLDIWCCPGSWLQYSSSLLTKLWVKDFHQVWFDIKDVDISIPNTNTYKQDITEKDEVQKILQKHNFDKIDLIQSDLAPNTIWFKNIDAIRSFAILEETLWIYKELLKPDWKFVIKLFMWPGFDEFIADLKQHFGAKKIKIFKPKSCRSISKEIYVIKI